MSISSLRMHDSLARSAIAPPTVHSHGTTSKVIAVFAAIFFACVAILLLPENGALFFAGLSLILLLTLVKRKNDPTSEVALAHFAPQPGKDLAGAPALKNSPNHFGPQPDHKTHSSPSKASMPCSPPGGAPITPTSPEIRASLSSIQSNHYSPQPDRLWKAAESPPSPDALRRRKVRRSPSSLHNAPPPPPVKSPSVGFSLRLYLPWPFR